jgi:putative transposase
MGRGVKFQIKLSARDRRQVDEVLSGGLQSVRTTLRALALRQMDQGQTTPLVGRNLGLSAKAVWQIGKRYEQEGLERALFDVARPGKAPALDQRQSQQIIAVVCSPPPEGRARWTVRLLTEEVIKRKLVPRVGRETIRVLLESHDLKPWREKNVVCGEVGPGVHRPHGGRAQDIRKAAVGARASGMR